MTEFLSPAVFEKVGVIGLCVFCVVALMRGWVVPGKWVQSRLDEKDAALARERASVDRLMEVGRTLEAVLTSVKDLAERRDR